MGFVIGLLLTVQMLACIFLVLIVLMQPSKADGGLGASFGSGATDTLFGARTGNVLTKATIWTATILFVNSVLLGLIFSRQASVVLKAPPAAEQKAVPETGGEKTAPSGTAEGTRTEKPAGVGKSAEPAAGPAPAGQPAEKPAPAPASK